MQGGAGPIAALLRLSSRWEIAIPIRSGSNLAATRLRTILIGWRSDSVERRDGTTCGLRFHQRGVFSRSAGWRCAIALDRSRRRDEIPDRRPRLGYHDL